MPSEPILKERRDRVLVITINRPEVRNAFDFATADALSNALDELEQDDQLRVAVLTGADGHFSAGMDLKAFQRGDVPYVAKRGIFGIVNAPPSKPLIAAVEGGALAGGFELMLACDMVVAADDARFGIPEVRRGPARRRRGAARSAEADPAGDRLRAGPDRRADQRLAGCGSGARQPGDGDGRRARGGPAAGRGDRRERAAGGRRLEAGAGRDAGLGPGAEMVDPGRDRGPGL